ncbi:peptidylprolyl isomerase [Polaribacter gangjinensis]|uniref:peptidylprolyl isomerase n=1 Tax=Polaribacter gangjinensis TaxID=574710 RepID=A0A2S7W927_9FLAO|nr:peptidylprolyl isomerase [Polaribacter gangjinensis]PQJ74130.1 peptidylprolyl isomerase [Polaribacter gangjinensis]
MKYLKLLLLIPFIFSCNSTKYEGLKDGLYAEIQTNKGDILLELYYEDVPMTVASFVSLAEGNNEKVPDSIKGKKYYDGIRFHRVVNNFIIQAGDPTETGKGFPGYRFGDEFPVDENNEYVYTHNDYGVLSMGNSGPDTNGSQFFITKTPSQHLDGKHAVFGKTIINSLQLKELKNQFSDTNKLQKAIDSLRLSVVNSIVQFDTIKTIKIIRIGDDAKKFDAPKVFEEEMVQYELGEEGRQKIKDAIEEKRYNEYLVNRNAFYAKLDESNAIKTASGLGFLVLKSNPKGQKVVDHKSIRAHFSLFLADGKKIQSTEDSGAPLVFRLDDKQRPMITGFAEGVRMMREGEKARLFVPYYIGFGEAAYGPFPAKSDLIFEVEIIEIEK